ncbi:hypothetical protein HYT33_00210 [Candidatus Roizmanbacteria bacterium]|nr:hypothetical protein [Candidatus Roizmanbacteria bacterium]
MKNFRQQLFRFFPWMLFTIVVSVGYAVWKQRAGPKYLPATLYEVFPLLGIWAWSIMWTHCANRCDDIYFYPCISTGDTSSRRMVPDILDFFRNYPFAVLHTHPYRRLAKPQKSECRTENKERRMMN